MLTHIKDIADDLTKVAEMKKLTELTVLNLSMTGISDSKLRLLIDHLPNLQMLSLQGKNIAIWPILWSASNLILDC